MISFSMHPEPDQNKRKNEKEKPIPEKNIRGFPSYERAKDTDQSKNP